MGRACYFTLILSGGDFKSIEDLKINWRNIAPQGLSPRDYWAQVACYDGSSPYDPYTPYLSWENEEAILRVLEIDEK